MALDFDPWLRLWRLTPDGEPFDSLAGRLMPVRAEGVPAMLKLTEAPEEIAGGALMEWWAGEGAARVLARQGGALLLERALGSQSLADMSRNGRDPEAMSILAAAAEQLHRPRASPPPASLKPLPDWFRALWPSAQARGGVFHRAAAAARDLLAASGAPVVLHGDLHHGNLLDFAERGWLVIDPKGLLGDRGYDFANMVCNPDAPTALAPGVFEHRLDLVGQASGLGSRTLAAWVLAYCGLSASWTLDGGGDAWQALAIAERAAAVLDGA